uniref:Uso1/p115-like vesicle tethering protein C-terminal domain-containing protein n=1 Tax=Brassica oleracea var. oleracea TaxID=109376 RepID=A0A0D3AWH1_BRAOL
MRIVDVYSRPKSEVAVVPADLEQRSGESEKDYINRLKAFIEKQCSEIQNLLARNAALAEDVASSGRKHSCETRIRPKGPVGRIQQSRTSELPSRERGEILVKEEVRKEAQKESEDELNDLLVCLGQEESKVEKLTAKLVELGVDVDKLLEDIGDESQAQGECEDDDDDDR